MNSIDIIIAEMILSILENMILITWQWKLGRNFYYSKKK